jgi:hypothetical protein
MNNSREMDHPMGRMCCGPWSGRSRAGFRLRMGTMLLLIGLIWLGMRVGWIDFTWLYAVPIWPLIVIMIGACMIYRGLRKRKAVESESDKEV